MDAVWVRKIVLNPSRNICGDNVYFFSANSSIHLIEPNGSTTLGGEKKLGDYEITATAFSHCRTLQYCLEQACKEYGLKASVRGEPDAHSVLLVDSN